MRKESKIKVAISQRIIPHYRIPVFADLAKRDNIDLTVFYGKGFSSGSQVNASKIAGFNNKRLFTIIFKIQNGQGLRVFHPTLFFHLLLGSYDVVIVEPTTNFFNDIFVFIYCKLFRKKFIWYDAGSEPKEKRSKYRRMMDPIISFFIKYADSYITYTSYADDSLMRYHNVQPDKIFRAQNTVDTSGYADAIKKYSGKVEEMKKILGVDGFKVSLYIGGIERRKKINNLITATANLNKKGIKAKTLIVGDGQDNEWILSNMTNYEKEYTFFAGKHIDDAVLYILLSDVVVLPSQGGLSVTQAFACGKPFIGSEEIEHGGIKDYVQNSYNGFLVKENDIPDLEKALEQVFVDHALFDKLSEGALETSKRITIEAMVDGIVRAINYCFNNKKAMANRYY